MHPDLGIDIFVPFPPTSERRIAAPVRRVSAHDVLLQKHLEFLGKSAANPCHVDEDDLESPSLTAIAKALEILSQYAAPRHCAPDGEGGLHLWWEGSEWKDRYSGPHTSLRIDRDGSVCRRQWFGEYVIRESCE